MPFDESFDLVIVGSGAAAVIASLVAKSKGQTSVIIEKSDKFGGSTAFSGGVLWMPLNPYLRDGDSMEAALKYFESTTGECTEASSLERRKAFIENSPKSIEFVRRYGMQFEHSNWPDYYSDRPGGSKEGRSLNAPLFDLRELGEWQDKVACHPNMPPVPVNTPDYVRLTAIIRRRCWAPCPACAFCATPCSAASIAGLAWLCRGACSRLPCAKNCRSGWKARLAA